jgi:hypothetical protein
MLSRVTKLVLLLAIFDIILASIDLIALVAYNLDVGWLYQYREPSTYYVGIAQLSCLLVTDARTVNFHSVRYNISLFIHRAGGFFFNRAEIHHTEK